ncbi:1357_t:CDS:2 [Entrophospora sp. SA101]|nr:1357_t:CDS:2 [Entrophospora sp. SA101]
MKFFEKFMPIFEGEEMENIIWPALDLYEKIHILVTHDESTFYANDGIKKFWGPQGEQPLRPKSQGASLHISEFLCETIGRLCLV